MRPLPAAVLLPDLLSREIHGKGDGGGAGEAATVLEDVLELEGYGRTTHLIMGSLGDVEEVLATRCGRNYDHVSVEDREAHTRGEAK